MKVWGLEKSRALSVSHSRVVKHPLKIPSGESMGNWAGHIPARVWASMFMLMKRMSVPTVMSCTGPLVKSCQCGLVVTSGVSRKTSMTFWHVLVQQQLNTHEQLYVLFNEQIQPRVQSMAGTSFEPDSSCCLIIV